MKNAPVKDSSRIADGSIAQESGCEQFVHVCSDRPKFATVYSPNAGREIRKRISGDCGLAGGKGDLQGRRPWSGSG